MQERFMQESQNHSNYSINGVWYYVFRIVIIVRLTAIIVSSAIG